MVLGRKHSRNFAKNAFTQKEMKDELKMHKVTLMGGSLEEAPMMYKDINQVMNAQQDLVDILGTFQPRIVRMDK
jgi:tRNA-splicing ligase RtcB